MVERWFVVINNYMVNTTKKYDWTQIQLDYDSGLSYRDLSRKYGMSQQSIANAKKRGDIITRTKSEACKISSKHNRPSRMSFEARQKLSKRMSENNPGGKSKWFEISGKKVQGTWERDLALYFDKHNIKWNRCTSIPYIIDGITRHYTPDFYLPETDIFVEVKGYWWGNDKIKMQLVIEQHNDKSFRIIEGGEFKKIMEGELVWL